MAASPQARYRSYMSLRARGHFGSSGQWFGAQLGGLCLVGLVACTPQRKGGAVTSPASLTAVDVPVAGPRDANPRDGVALTGNPDDVESAEVLAAMCKAAPLGRACERYATALYFGELGAEQSQVAAMEQWEALCERKPLAEACFNLGVAYRHNDELAHDDVKARQLFVKACDLKWGPGCNNLATLLYDGIGGPADKPRAVALYMQSCTLGDAVACGNASDEQITAAQLQMAIKGLQKGCNDGDVVACRFLAERLADGIGIARDVQQAAVMMSQACKAGDARACESKSYYQLRAEHVYTAVELRELRKRCQAKRDNGVPCLKLGIVTAFGFAGVAVDERGGASLYRKACEQGAPEGCFRYALQFEDRKPAHPDDAATKVRYYEMGCARKFGKACFNLGIELESKDSKFYDVARANTAYRDACENGDVKGCFNLGNNYHQGVGGPVNYALSAHYFGKGCEAQHGDSCYNLGLAYSKGRGVEQSNKRAKEAFVRGCESGEKDSCRVLEEHFGD